jgi:hypothetical protein
MGTGVWHGDVAREWAAGVGFRGFGELGHSAMGGGRVWRGGMWVYMGSQGSVGPQCHGGWAGKGVGGYLGGHVGVYGKPGFSWATVPWGVDG